MGKKSKQNSGEERTSLESINNRLDALIRILLEIHFDKDNKFNLTAAVKTLNSCGLGPTEIGKIFGKKKTDITPLLYAKSKKKGKSAEREGQEV